MSVQTRLVSISFLSTLSLRRATLMWYQCNTVVKEFLSTLSLRRATDGWESSGKFLIFLSTLSLRRATITAGPGMTTSRNFYPRSPCGERPLKCVLPWMTSRFLSTLSLRRATHHRAQGDQLRHISIHALLAESDYLVGGHHRPQSHISIHALLAESDKGICFNAQVPKHFYPRSPCGERPFAAPWCMSRDDFYPRSPCGERLSDLVIASDIMHFYPRSPCGERQYIFSGNNQYICISIHALLAESDPHNRAAHCKVSHFYPRSPCGERLQQLLQCLNVCDISIHALLAESDLKKMSIIKP